MLLDRLRSLLSTQRQLPPHTTPRFTKDQPGFGDYEIGEFTYGAPRVLSWGEGAKLRIGKYCSIADQVTILLGGEHRTDWVSTFPFTEMMTLGLKIEGHPSTRGDVVIGNDVWIGHGATLRSGVHVGDGAVIGARAVVTADVASYSIVAGNPARSIRQRFSDDVIAELAQLRWWDWPAKRVAAAVPFLMSPDVSALITYGRQTDESPKNSSNVGTDNK